MTVTLKIGDDKPLHVDLPGVPRCDELISFPSPGGPRQVRVRGVQWQANLGGAPGEPILYCNEVAG